MNVETAIKQICERLGDPDYERYADSSSDYDGLAKNELVNALILLMNDPETNQEDIHGYVKEYPVAISEDGEIDLSEIGVVDEKDQVLRVIDYYSNPDGTAPLESIIEKIDFDQFREFAGSGLLETNTETVYAYRVGDTLKFYPKERDEVNIVEDKEINIIYVAQPVVSGDESDGSLNCEDTELFTYFTIKLIIKAINIAVANLLQARNQ